MSLMKVREPRSPVRITVRVKTDFGWSDAEIRNISSRGMMANCAAPPGRGAYVEIKSGSYLAVGRVTWSSGDHFGIYTQDHITVSDLTNATKLSIPTGRIPHRTERLPTRGVNVAALAESSARFARAFEFVAIGTAAVVASMLAAAGAIIVLSDPLERIGATLQSD